MAHQRVYEDRSDLLFSRDEQDDFLDTSSEIWLINRRKQCQWMFSFRGKGRDLGICWYTYIANSASRIRPAPS